MVVLEGYKEYSMALLAREKTGVSHIAIGTGTPSSSGLGQERGRRAIKSVSKPSDKARLWEAFFEDSYPPSTYTLTEVGLIGANEVFIAATTIAPLVKKVGVDSLVVRYKLYY